MDSTIARGARGKKAASAASEGLSGVFRTLARQHAQASALCKRLEYDPSERADRWPTIRRELLAHERAEMQVVYPALRGNPETADLAIQHAAEAHDLEQLIDQLDRLADDPDEHRWNTLFRELVQSVGAHATREEEEIFPQAQGVLSRAEIEALDQRFMAANREIAATA
jgi:hemerythrin superfamily protein